MSDPEPQKKRRGCFFYGCITCLALFALVVGVVFFAGWYGIHWLNGMIAEYSETSPATLPKVEMPADELARLKARVADFRHALDAHTNTPPLMLDGRELNALLENDPQVTQMELNDKLHVDPEGDGFKGQISVPLDALSRIPFVHASGRYLNATGDFTATVTNAALALSIKSLEAKGKPLPPAITTWLQGFVLSMANNNPTNTASMGRFESIEVKDGSLIITARPD